MHVVLPRCTLQLLARDNLLGMREQMTQQPELDRAEVNFATTASHPIGDQVHLHIGIPKGPRPVGASVGGVVPAAQNGGHTLDQGGRRYRPDQHFTNPRLDQVDLHLAEAPVQIEGIESLAGTAQSVQTSAGVGEGIPDDP